MAMSSSSTLCACMVLLSINSYHEFRLLIGDHPLHTHAVCITACMTLHMSAVTKMTELCEYHCKSGSLSSTRQDNKVLERSRSSIMVFTPHASNIWSTP